VIYHTISSTPRRTEQNAGLLGEVAEHFLKRALVDFRNETQGKKEHLLSWPFLGQAPEAAWISNR